MCNALSKKKGEKRKEYDTGQMSYSSVKKFEATSQNTSVLHLF